MVVSKEDPPMRTCRRLSTISICWLAIFACICAARGEEAEDRSREDEMIARIRRGTLVVETAPGAAVEVEQLRHEFWFGAALASHMFVPGRRPEETDRYKEVFLANFNCAVTENALKWAPMEPRQGQVNHAVVDAILDWADANEIPVRGHCLFWGVKGRVQDWVQALDDEALREALRTRAASVAKRYRGRFAEYDLNNEMLHQNYYEDRLGRGITREMASWVREGDPGAVLFVNDYDILTGRMVDRYARQIRGLLEEGVPIGGIGVQGHLHGDTFDAKALKESLDKLAELKLPIRVTEFNMPGQRSRFYSKRNVRLTDEAEEEKARNLVAYYRACFAHSAVDGILMWGFWEGANWIPASSLYRRDWSPTPAA
ncbi:MAG: endo-1,4-beta-xylanase, partial [Planctomycetes bacterium]|nr:endo-1,4-beta-xylanase [Planctomycetota bacterium]